MYTQLLIKIYLFSRAWLPLETRSKYARRQYSMRHSWQIINSIGRPTGTMSALPGYCDVGNWTFMDHLAANRLKIPLNIHVYFDFLVIFVEASDSLPIECQWTEVSLAYGLFASFWIIETISQSRGLDTLRWDRGWGESSCPFHHQDGRPLANRSHF